jgi:geranylgeranyl diphosphate synthase type II
MGYNLPVVTFDLEEYLAARRATIDRALERYFDKPSDCPASLRRAMRYGLFPGGKRIRPILTLAAGEVFEAKPKELLPFACAIEMIHAYSLIHDDLPALDDDDLRRGIPTAHKVFGEGMALLAGDALLTEAFNLISGPATRGIDAQLALELIHELGRAASVAGLVGGQAIDLETEKKTVDLATVQSMHERKTGALILASVKIGARAGGASAAELKRISRYGEAIGLAFQIADDLLDLPGAKNESGRKEETKATYPAIAGVQGAEERLRALMRQAVKSVAFFGDKAEPLKAIAVYVAERALGHGENSYREENKG